MSNGATFADHRVEQLVQEISKFSPESLKDALDRYNANVISKLGVERSGQIVSWGILVELHYATAVFEIFDRRFRRANSIASEKQVAQLMQTCMKLSSVPQRISSATISFGQEPRAFIAMLEERLTRIHIKEISDEEYQWLNEATKSLLGTMLVYSLPQIESFGIPPLDNLLDQESRKAYNISFQDLRVLKQITDGYTGSNQNLVRIEQGEPMHLAKQFILGPDELLASSLDELVIRQPVFFRAPDGQFKVHQLVRPIAYVRTLAYEEMQKIADKYSNFEGMSLESFIQKFLSEYLATFDPTKPDFNLRAGKRFDVKPNEIINHSEFPRLFEKLEDHEKPALEVDAVVNGDGYSLLIESKYCRHGGTAKKYYLSGIDDEAEQTMLQKLAAYVREDQALQAFLSIPKGNKIGGAFVTNQHGRFFALDDGNFKVSTWEIFMDGWLERLVKDHPENLN